MIEMHVKDMEPDPGFWVSFERQILYSKCSQDWSQLLDSDNDTKTTYNLGKHELRHGWLSIFKIFLLPNLLQTSNVRKNYDPNDC